MLANIAATSQDRSVAEAKRRRPSCSEGKGESEDGRSVPSKCFPPVATVTIKNRYMRSAVQRPPTYAVVLYSHTVQYIAPERHPVLLLLLSRNELSQLTLLFSYTYWNRFDS